MIKRSSGILVHPTSFPGPYGCGDLGEKARKVVDWLKESGQSILQVLPLGPTGYGDSPYQAFSAFAGTPYIISFDELLNKGYLHKSELKKYPHFSDDRVDYNGLYHNKFKILFQAFVHFESTKKKDKFNKFCRENADWLDSYAMFMALKDRNNGKCWNEWDPDERKYDPYYHLPDDVEDLVEFYKFLQWEFFTQWMDFKKYANDKGITIVGDAPIFVSYDSADVWANQDLFYLDKEGRPEIVAGVPPDYFSETGQLWGNPIYKWKLMKKNNFKWWKKRIAHLLKLVDCIRIDHFRGFEAYWEIKYGEETAINGKWVKVPGDEFFNSLKEEYGDKLKDYIIAEDLGVITDDVRALRDKYNLPGMRIFEFANFPKGDDAKKSGDHINDFSEDGYLPENYVENCIAYPGTHDNDTIKGWFDSLSKELQKDVLKYLNIDSDKNLNYAIIECLMKSAADRVVFLLQDVLELSTENRMNFPGTCGTHNWSWRLDEKMLNKKTADKLKKLTEENNR